MNMNSITKYTKIVTPLKAIQWNKPGDFPEIEKDSLRFLTVENRTGYFIDRLPINSTDWILFNDYNGHILVTAVISNDVYKKNFGDLQI